MASRRAIVTKSCSVCNVVTKSIVYLADKNNRSLDEEVFTTPTCHPNDEYSVHTKIEKCKRFGGKLLFRRTNSHSGLNLLFEPRDEESK